ncbi:MarR family winged helix-turn-helix transcriptional regulator [Prolixibacteraceae bacterium Z1-6]|uniref:MarR family winged helix-turn-helix transcriptional regulator n=1 Tax=Draconibacterium aestuarii TaxID=2998507 RepID=A0A9X3FAA1_9BACT|nr:MarR family winged helix-turn-helix transcriptional regulator [Prolixibacteraceae bacterium Z1-6]
MNTEKPLTYLLGLTYNLIIIKLQQSFSENNIDLNKVHYILLNLISSNPNLTQQELAIHLQKDKSLILRYVETLIEKSLVERTIDDDDKRKKNLILTPKGQDTLKMLRNISRQLSDELLTGISKDEQETFLKVIQKIQDNTGQNFELGKINRCKIN